MGMAGSLSKNVMPFIGLAISVALGLIVLSNFKDTGVGTANANTTIDNIITGIMYVGTFAGIIVLVLIAKPLIKMISPDGGGF